MSYSTTGIKLPCKLINGWFWAWLTRREKEGLHQTADVKVLVAARGPTFSHSISRPDFKPSQTKLLDYKSPVWACAHLRDPTSSEVSGVSDSFSHLDHITPYGQASEAQNHESDGSQDSYSHKGAGELNLRSPRVTSDRGVDDLEALGSGDQSDTDELKSTLNVQTKLDLRKKYSNILESNRSPGGSDDGAGSKNLDQYLYDRLALQIFESTSFKTSLIISRSATEGVPH